MSDPYDALAESRTAAGAGSQPGGGSESDVSASAPEPGGVDEVTGEPRVDAALTRLREIEGTALSEHVAAYDDVHRLLQDALADLDGE